MASPPLAGPPQRAHRRSLRSASPSPQRYRSPRRGPIRATHSGGIAWNPRAAPVIAPAMAAMVSVSRPMFTAPRRHMRKIAMCRRDQPERQSDRLRPEVGPGVGAGDHDALPARPSALHTSALAALPPRRDRSTAASRNPRVRHPVPRRSPRGAPHLPSPWATAAATAFPAWIPSPAWVTRPSVSASSAAREGRPAAAMPNGATRMASPSLQA